MKLNFELIALAIEMVISMYIYTTKPEFVYASVGPESNGFNIRSNKTNGDRCVMKEGAVLSVSNWNEMAKHYVLPTNICD